ncbi:MAG: NYN domain-containing protein [Anaeroplasma sp.]
MSDNDNKKYAVLIDSENAQYDKMNEIFQELTLYGDTPIRYLVGDFTNSHISHWIEVCKKHAITCIQTINFTKGKNSLDISLVIEGMKILYEKTFIDGIVIVASDSDYTSLAREWRNAGKKVIGIGEEKTPESFRSSCNNFIFLENIIKKIDSDVSSETSNETQISLTDIKGIAELCLNNNNGKELLSRVVETIKKAYSSFDYRSYGYRNAKDFFSKSFDNFVIVPYSNSKTTFCLAFKDVVDIEEAKEIKNMTVKKKNVKLNKKDETKSKKENFTPEIKNKIVEIFKSLNVKSISINEFANVLNKKNIKCRDCGYKKFKDMILNVEELIVEDNFVFLKNNFSGVKISIEEVEDKLDFHEDKNDN